MSRIHELIARLCPAGVQHQPLDQLLKYEQPGKYLVVTTNYSDAHKTPVLTAGRTFVLGYTEETEGIYPASPSSPVVIFDDFTTAFKWVDFPFKAKSSAMKMLTVRSSEEASLRYIFYAMQTIKYLPQDHARQWIGTYSKFSIPVPPLEVQREIVSVLDTFTELKAGIEAELEARAQQRHALASRFFSARSGSSRMRNGYQRIALGELATQFIDTVRVSPAENYVNLGVKWYGAGVLSRGSKRGSAIKGTTLRRVRAGQFIYNRMFVVEGSFALVTPDFADGVVSNEFPVYDLDGDRVLPDWLMHYFQDEYTLERVTAEVTGVERGSMKSRRRWKEDQFEAFEIDLPPIEVQRQVVAVLGGIQQLEASLLAELAARSEQYEFYRDTLLTFEELVS